MKQINISTPKHPNTFTIVDDDMFEYLNQWKWGFNGKYAFRSIKELNWKSVNMHRIIMNTPKGMDTDHINGNKLDNRRENLRICTRSQNVMNVPVRRDSSTGYRGVQRDKRNKHKCWTARITVNKKRVTLGYFYTIQEAVEAYTKASKKYYGEFSRL